MTAEELIAFEADIAAEFNAGRIRAPVHLSGGNETDLIQYFEDYVRPEDWLALTWRSHYACLMKGVPPARLKADIMAGRSITLAYPDFRIISSAIVGGSIPIALGIALSIKRRGGAEKVHAFVGDMAERTGIFHECAQYARGHDLPLRFVIENNGKSVCTPTNEVWGTKGSPYPNFSYSYELPWPHAGAGQRVQF